MAYHAVLAPHLTYNLLGYGRRPVGPGGLVRTSYLSVFRVELCALGVVRGGGLMRVGAEGVFI